MTRNAAVDTVVDYNAVQDDPSQSASRWALARLMSARTLNTGERMTLLATAVAADISLASVNGYSGHRADQIAAVTGVSPSTTRNHHRALVRAGLLVERHVGGVLVVRIPEEAFGN